MPKPNNKRSSEFSLESSIAWIILSDALSPTVSKAINWSFLTWYKSAGLWTLALSYICSRTDGPTPVIFMAFRDTKCYNCSFAWAGQAGFTHLIVTSSSKWTRSLWQTGQVVGFGYGVESSALLSKPTVTTSGIISPALWIITLSFRRISLTSIKSILWRLAR